VQRQDSDSRLNPSSIIASSGESNHVTLAQQCQIRYAHSTILPLFWLTSSSLTPTLESSSSKPFFRICQVLQIRVPSLTRRLMKEIGLSRIISSKGNCCENVLDQHAGNEEGSTITCILRVSFGPPRQVVKAFKEDKNRVNSGSFWVLKIFSAIFKTKIIQVQNHYIHSSLYSSGKCWLTYSSRCSAPHGLPQPPSTSVISRHAPRYGSKNSSHQIATTAQAPKKLLTMIGSACAKQRAS
jgi:hypothetical protein